jgi:hypothetical protein
MVSVCWLGIALAVFFSFYLQLIVSFCNFFVFSGLGPSDRVLTFVDFSLEASLQQYTPPWSWHHLVWVQRTSSQVVSLNFLLFAFLYFCLIAVDTGHCPKLIFIRMNSNISSIINASNKLSAIYEAIFSLIFQFHIICYLFLVFMAHTGIFQLEFFLIFYGSSQKGHVI